MVGLNWTDQSVADLISIANFISRDSLRYAKRIVSRIRQRAKQLKAHPNSGRILPELQLPEVRELLIGNYRLIYFLVSENQIDILSIHHSTKRLDAQEITNQIS
jgi:toxin ParE1/3/4